MTSACKTGLLPRRHRIERAVVEIFLETLAIMIKPEELNLRAHEMSTNTVQLMTIDCDSALYQRRLCFKGRRPRIFQSYFI